MPVSFGHLLFQLDGQTQVSSRHVYNEEKSRGEKLARRHSLQSHETDRKLFPRVMRLHAIRIVRGRRDHCPIPYLDLRLLGIRGLGAQSNLDFFPEGSPAGEGIGRMHAGCQTTVV